MTDYVYHRQDAARLAFLTGLHTCDLLVLDDFLTTPIPGETAAELLNILAAREGRGSTVVTSQFDPEDWYRSLHDLSRADLVPCDGDENVGGVRAGRGGRGDLVAADADGDVAERAQGPDDLADAVAGGLLQVA